VAERKTKAKDDKKKLKSAQSCGDGGEEQAGKGGNEDEAHEAGAAMEVQPVESQQKQEQAEGNCVQADEAAGERCEGEGQPGAAAEEEEQLKRALQASLEDGQPTKMSMCHSHQMRRGHPKLSDVSDVPDGMGSSDPDAGSQFFAKLNLASTSSSEAQAAAAAAGAPPVAPPSSQPDLDAQPRREVVTSAASGRFSYQMLATATQGFTRRLGGGGSGSVFLGTLKSGTKVAVKRLELDEMGSWQVHLMAQMRREVEVLSQVRACLLGEVEGRTRAGESICNMRMHARGARGG